MSVNVLPDMDEPRLKCLGKQLNRNRKSSLINTGKEKQKLDVYVKTLNKEKRSLDGKYSVRGLRLKKSLARVRGTQKVLHARREQSFWEDSDEYPYGVYEGESLASYRRQVDTIIEQKHPKYRRMRKVENQLKTWRSTGKIIDNQVAREEFDEIMKYGRRTHGLRRENPLTQTFISNSIAARTGNHMDHLWKDPTMKRNLKLKHLNGLHDADDDLSPIHTPTEGKLNDRKAPRDTSRLYSPKTTSDMDDGGPNDGLKRTRRANATHKTSNDSPNTDRSTDFDEDFQDYLTVKSSPSKLNLPPITASKNLYKTNQAKDNMKSVGASSKHSIRRVTKADVANSLSMENLKKFEQLKNRRATTFL